MTDELLLSVRDVTVGWEDVRLCSGISFDLHAGEYLSVVGPVGCGKSALIAAILGVEPVKAGVIRYEGGLCRADIGCVPQESDLRGAATVREIVLGGIVGHTRHIFVGREEKALAADAMERMGLSALAKRRFGDLSGGQRQKALLARALCGAKRLLLLDEPMKGLDARAKDEMFDEIARIRDEGHIAIVIVDRDAVDGTVLHLSDEMRFCGPVEEYVESVPGRLYFAGRTI
ncbi:MAG: ATP-binding cassette domain-containing protein [Clostridia bacterium]|nr:ATP-binding cassette domain-containing protein [Clostridia bacterium]